MNEKICCTECGFNFPHTVIRYRDELPYCELCDLMIYTERLRELEGIRTPGYFFNEKHQDNFWSLMNGPFKKYKSKDNYVLASYINSIPAVFNLYPHNYDVFIVNPTLWQFNWTLFYMTTPNEKLQANLTIPGDLIQHNAIDRLNNDCKILLKFGHILFPVTEKEKEQFLPFCRRYIEKVEHALSYSGKTMIDEIMKYYFESKGGLI